MNGRMQDKLGDLERLKALLDQGALTQEEFEREKGLVFAADASRSTIYRKVVVLAAGAVVASGIGILLASQFVQPVAPVAKTSAAALPAPAPSTVEMKPISVDPYEGAKLKGCRQDTCSWTKVLDVRTIKRMGNGILKLEETYEGSLDARRRETPSQYSRSLPIKWESKPVQTYVFCSLDQPSIAFKNRWEGGDGKWIGHLLDPFETYGYNWSSAEIYMRVCHGVKFGRKDISKVLRRLGYHPGTRNEQVGLSKPTDLVSPPPPVTEDDEPAAL